MTDARPRRERTATESLVGVVLVLEAFVVFFLTMTAFGLKTVDPVWAFGGGGVFAVLLVVTAGLVRYSWGITLGWVLEALLVATGFVVPIMFAIGLAFAGIWTFCLIKGRQLDAAKAAYLAEHSNTADHSNRQEES